MQYIVNLKQNTVGDFLGMFRGPLDTRSLVEVPDPLLCGSCCGYHFGGAKEKRKQKSKVLRVEICCLTLNVVDDFLGD